MKTTTPIHQHKTHMSNRDRLVQLFPNHSYNMINVGKKAPTARCALAQGKIHIGEEAFNHIKNKTMPKGDPLVLAEIAGINGAKCAYQFIPLCHPLNLEQVIVYTVANEADYSIMVYCLAAAFAKTGVEMEALAGVNTALLSIYDLCKIVNADLAISDIRLLFKEGGKSGVWMHKLGIPEDIQAILAKTQDPLKDLRTLVIELSDRAYRREDNYPDIGVHLKAELERLGATPVDYVLLPDDKRQIKEKIKAAAMSQYDLIMLHGGTGLGAQDVTTSAVTEVADRIIPGVGELLRKHGENYTPYTWLSSSIGAVLNQSLIVAIPGNKHAIYESMQILPELIAKAVHELHRTT